MLKVLPILRMYAFICSQFCKIIEFKYIKEPGGSESFPFTFRTFPKLLKPFPVADYSFPGRGKQGKDLSPFPKLLKPFPVANYSFPGKGTFPKIAETFHSCSLSFPFPVAAFPFPVVTFPFPVVTFPAFPGNSPLLGPFYILHHSDLEL